MCNIYKHNYNQCIKSIGRTIYNANRHIYTMEESFGLTEIQSLKYTSGQISRFCLHFSVTVLLVYFSNSVTYPISQSEALCCYHLPVWKVCIARRKYRPRHFDAFYYILIFISLPYQNRWFDERALSAFRIVISKNHRQIPRDLSCDRP
jgi:hypothetical protein